MEKRPNLHIRGLSMDNVGQFERITIINMQMNAYLYCNPFEREMHTGYATLHTARATVIGMKARIEQRKKGGEENNYFAHPRTQGGRRMEGAEVVDHQTFTPGKVLHIKMHPIN